jgi:hypothetical protein
MPRPLNFHQQWIDPILAGSKRVTVRKGGSGYRRGDVVKAMRRNHPAFAQLCIERVQTVRLEDLTARQAKLDGHANVDELKSAVTRLYPGVAEFDIISFRVA